MTTIPAASIARLHTICAAAAFLSALVVGGVLHYKKIVKNDVAEYPDEWFPSVSATYETARLSTLSATHHSFYSIGDWFPERNLFQLLIAITSGASSAYSTKLLPKFLSGPRFSLVFLQYYLHRSATSFLPTVVFFFGIVRTFSCGGWVYVTSTDHHDIHDFMMILYIISNIPWMLVGTATTPLTRPEVRKRRFVTLFLSAYACDNSFPENL
jgi:hypothetical protein